MQTCRYIQRTPKLPQVIKNTISVLLTCCITNILLSADYYVSPGGNDSNPGSVSSPWRTIGHAIGKVSGGDTVYVQDGEYFEQVNINKSGQVSAPIKFIGIGNPTIRNGNNNVRLSGQYIIFDGFEIRNTSISGVVISGSNNQLRNCIIHNNAGDGVEIRTVENVIVFGGKIYNNKVGIRLQGKATNLVFDSIDIYSTGGSNGKQEAGIKAWNGGGTKNWTMRNLQIHDHPRYGAEIMPSSSARMYDVFMTDCHFYNNGIGAPSEIPGIKFRAANLLIQRVTNGTLERNIFERGMGWGVDIYTSKKYKVCNNLFLNNYDSQSNPVGPGFGLEVNASDQTEVYNNTFYGNDTALLISYLDSGHDWPPGKFTVTVHNNIFDNSRKRDYLELLDKYEDDTTIIMDTNMSNTNPRFADPNNGDFHLNSNSPAIDKGKTVNVVEDYDRISRPQGGKIDIGMYEYCVSPCNGGIIGPEGYDYAVEESQIIRISDVPYDVAYGQDGQYEYLLEQRADVSCVNESFGNDPFPGIKKYCFIRESKAPYPETATKIPGTIKAENYDYGGAGRSYLDEDVENRGDVGFRENDGVDIGLASGDVGYVVGWMTTGEWLEYTVEVSQSTMYNFKFYTASPDGSGMLGLDIDGQELETGIQIPQTGDWDSFSSFEISAQLPEGKHVIRLTVEQSGFNLDKVEVTANSLSVDNFTREIISIHPNPSKTGIFNLSAKMPYRIYTINGTLLHNDYSDQVDLSKFSHGIYILKSGNVVQKLMR